MTTLAAPKKTYELVAFLCLIPALYIQIKWLQVYMNKSSYSPEAKAGAFADSFPSIFSSATVISLISLVFAVLAIVFASKSFNQKKIFLRLSSFAVVFVAAAIALLSVFQIL